MTRSFHKLAGAAQVGRCLVVLVALAAGPLWAQTSHDVPAPADRSAAITFGSRLIQGWYAEGKLHVFLMIDGFKVTQDGWKLSARDGVVWFDEAAVGADGEKILGIYAEENVVIEAPGRQRPIRLNRLYRAAQP